MNDNELLKRNHRANEILFKGLVEFGCFKAAPLNIFQRNSCKRCMIIYLKNKRAERLFFY